MSSGGSKLFKLTLKKTPSQPAIHPSNGVQPVGSGEQRARAPLPQAAAATPPIPTAAAGARPAAPGTAPRKLGLTLKGSKSIGTPQASAGTPAAPRITLRGAGSSGHATPAAATPAPQQAAVPATPSSAPSTGPRRLALKGQISRPPAAAAGTPATPAPAAAATPASAPRTAPPAVASAAGGFATPRPAAAAAATPARAASTTPAGGSAQASKPKTGLGIRLKGSSSTPASAGGPARMQSATPGSMPRPAATPGSAASAGGGLGPLKPRITLNKSRGRQNSMGLSQQHSMQSQHSLQHSVGHGPLQPVAQKQEAYKQEQQAAEQAAQAAAQHYDYCSSQGLQGYDSSQAAAGYGAMPSGSYMSHDYSGAAAAGAVDPAAAAAAGMYGMSADYGAMGAHASTDPAAAAAAAGGMYGAAHDATYGMHGGYDPAAAAATAVVDYSAHAYYQPQKQKGVKRGRALASARPAAAPAAPAEPLGPRAKRPKPGQFRDTEEEDADEDFNPKAERARMARGGGGGGGSGGIATARVKSKGPSGARAASAWPAARPAPATRPGSNRAAAAQKAAHRAAQNAAQRMHPHAHVGAPQRAGGGHMSAVVPTHRPRQHMMPVGSGALAFAPSGPRSPVLGEDSVLPSGADLAAAFNQSAAAQDLGTAMSIDLETAGSDAAVAAPVAAAPVAQRGRGRQGGGQQRRSVETVLAELHQQVEYVEETHPPTRENLIKLLAAVDKRDKYRFFVKPVTEEQAPGYSGIIKNPMDLSVMKTKVEGGMYSSWNELMADIILMCANAKVYNHPNTKPHKEADVLFKYSMKYVKSFKQGKTALRGAVAMAVRNANADTAAGSGGAAGASGGGTESGADAKAAAAPSGPMTRNARRGGRRPREEDEAANKTNKRQRQPKFIPLSQNLDIGGSTVDVDSARETFKGRPKMYAALWGGLADGASPEGVPFGGCDKPILRCVAGHVGSLPPDTYLKSLSRFVVGAGAAVEKLVLSLLGQDLGSKLIPIPGVSPAQQAGAHAAAHRPPHHQQQQQQLAAAGTGAQLPVHQARAGAAPAPLQPGGQQQSLAGIFGAGGLTPAQLQALQQNQLQQQLRQQQQQGALQQAGQQFVPGPGSMSMARAP